MKPVYQITLFSLLFGFMMALHIIESSFFFIPVGGYPLKIGVSNLVVVVVLFFFSSSSAVFMVLLKIFALALFEPRSTAFSTLISASGSLISLAVMLMAKKWLKDKVHLTSTLGGMMHNLGQWLAVFFITQLTILWYFLPLLILGGALAGFLVGEVSQKMLQKLAMLKKNHRY